MKLSLVKGVGLGFFWFFLLFVLVWMVLFSFRPTWVMLAGTTDKTNINNIDYPKLLLYTILITLLVMVVLYVLSRCGC